MAGRLMAQPVYPHSRLKLTPGHVRNSPRRDAPGQPDEVLVQPRTDLGWATARKRLRRPGSAQAILHQQKLALPRGDEGRLMKALKNNNKSASPLLHCYHAVLPPTSTGKHLRKADWSRKLVPGIIAE